MNCPTCNNLEFELQAAAREFSRAVQQAHVAIDGIAGMACGNRIEGAEEAVRIATHMLEQHRAECPCKTQ